MRKLEIKDAETIKVSVLDEIHRSEESRYDYRLHGILLACVLLHSELEYPPGYVYVVKKMF